MPLLLALRFWETYVPVVVPEAPPPSDICYPRELVGATAFSRMAAPVSAFARSTVGAAAYSRATLASTLWTRGRLTDPEFGRASEPLCVTEASVAGVEEVPAGYGDDYGYNFGGGA